MTAFIGSSVLSGSPKTLSLEALRAHPCSAPSVEGAGPISVALGDGRRAEGVRLADHPAVPLSQRQDDRGRRQAADLQQDEDEVVAMKGERADEQAAQEPHRPGAAADAGRATLLREMNHLG